MCKGAYTSIALPCAAICDDDSRQTFQSKM